MSKIKAVDLITALLPLAIVGGAAAYAGVKTSMSKKKLKKHIDEKLAGRNTEQDVINATVLNKELAEEDRAQAMKILSNLRYSVCNAKTIEEFDKSLRTLDTIIAVLNSHDENATKALINYYICEMNEAEKHRLEQLETEREVIRFDSAKQLLEAYKPVNVDLKNVVHDVLGAQANSK